jgi:hypothetical protein
MMPTLCDGGDVVPRLFKLLSDLVAAVSLVLRRSFKSTSNVDSVASFLESRAEEVFEALAEKVF